MDHPSTIDISFRPHSPTSMNRKTYKALEEQVKFFGEQIHEGKKIICFTDVSGNHFAINTDHVEVIQIVRGYP